MLKAAFRRAWQKEYEIKELDENGNGDSGAVSRVPAIRVDPAESPTIHASPASSTKWSPAIMRSPKDEDIPFELPPSVLDNFTLNSNQTDTEMMKSPYDRNHFRSKSFKHGEGKSRGGNGGANDKDEDSKMHRRTVSMDFKAHQRVVSMFANDELSRKFDLQDNNGLGRIQPELYKAPVCGCNSRCGRVWFSVVYDGAVEALTVKVLKIKQLPPRSISPEEVPRDSFVKVFLLPDEKHSHQTKIRHKCNNPVFNETFSFQVSNSEIRQKTLRLSVFDDDKRTLSRNLLGHALVGLNDVDFSKANEEMWKDLDEIAKPGESGSSRGDLYISLSYIPSVERLSVAVKEAKNLRKIDLDATDVYVKVALYHGNNLIKTKKTSTKTGILDLVYNELFQYKLTSDDLEQTSLTFTVITRPGHGSLFKLKSSVRHALTRGRYGVENKYGRTTIGFFHSTGEQTLHWQEILSQAPKSIAKWHALTEVVD